MKRLVSRVPAIVYKSFRRFTLVADLSQLYGRGMILAKMKTKTALSFLYLQHGNLLPKNEQVENQSIGRQRWG
jgi:hypothetical protein